MKPKVLYHGSPFKNLNIIKPMAITIRDSKEGPLIFATPDKAYASTFIVSRDDSWTVSGQYQGRYFIIISDEKRYRELDKGGAIYSVKVDGFSTDPTKGIKNKEWFSYTPVKPINVETYPSGLKAMKQLGITMYFVDFNSFRRFKNKLAENNPESAFELLIA